MEIDITEFKRLFENDLYKFADSVAHSGKKDIGQVTWKNALDCDYQIVTDENRNKIRQYFFDTGAWPEDELLDDIKLNALMIQEVSIQLQEGENSVNIRYDGDENCYFVD